MREHEKPIERACQPRISVVIPTYQRSDLLGRALDSVYAQTYPNFEVVIADDNLPGSESAERTRSVLAPYQARGNLVYVQTAGAVGGGGARNLAISRASGEYVAFLDDDDRYLPDKLEKQLRFMQENGLDLCYQDVKWVDSNEKLVEFRRMDYTGDFSQEGLLKAHILHSICPTAIYMVRRDKLLQTEGFGEVSSGQDFILMLRCIESGMKIGYMPGAFVVQYLHKGERVSTGKSKIQGENMLYRLKHKYLHLLRPSERRYVRFRHYAVLAFASLRTRWFLRAAWYACIAGLISPIQCLKEAKRYFGSKKG
ncbi:MAG: glycosyltransferase [Firmicutes bacterium]|nr:glycosyltransferase [Bacillota bacterium]